MTKDPTFAEIKKETVEAIQRIENYIAEDKETRDELIRLVSKMSLKIYGDEEANPPIAGLEQRLRDLEKVEKHRLQYKSEALKIAIGSFTIAVGGIIVWILVSLKEAFLKAR